MFHIVLVPFLPVNLAPLSCLSAVALFLGEWLRLAGGNLEARLTLVLHSLDVAVHPRPEHRVPGLHAVNAAVAPVEGLEHLAS